MNLVVKEFFIILSIVLLSGIVSNSFSQKIDDDYCRYVNPLIDTHASRWDYFASATLPFGMVALSPDTKHGDLWKAGYQYDENYILNFSHVHNSQTAGIPVMPTIGVMRGNEGLEKNSSDFDHSNEIAEPGYHRVFLNKYNIEVELTATNRVGFHKYKFPKTDSAHIIFDLAADLGPTKISHAWARKVNDHSIEGYVINAPTFRRKKPFMVFFFVEYSEPFDLFGGWVRKENEEIGSIIFENFVTGDDCGIFTTFYDLSEGSEIKIKVGISYTSIDNARKNLNEELSHWEFDKVVRNAKKEWNEYLGRIHVEGRNLEQKEKFYTDLYHTASRRIINDVNGDYPDWTGTNYVIRSLPKDGDGNLKRQILDFDALWGTHWNLNILWCLVFPEYGNWIAETCLEYYKNAGIMSRSSWGGNYSYVMVGDQATPLIAALISTKRATFDSELAYKAAKKNAFLGGIRDRAGYEAGSNPLGGGIDLYTGLGYIPVEISGRGDGYHRGGAAMTMEYAYQDWCLSVMADILGYENDADYFKRRSENWRNIFDTSIGWVRPKYMSGEWLEEFSPVSVTGETPIGFIEGNSAIYTFYVPHNIRGLIDAMGGKDQFVSKLDSSFIKSEPFNFVSDHGKHGAGWVDYENQPSCAMAHLFSYAGVPWKTQYWLDRIKKLTFQGNDPYSGYNGDEDQGQLGALSALISIGLFDVQGCVGEAPTIGITTPSFDKITMKIPALGHSEQNIIFEIISKRESDKDIYINSVIFNSKEWLGFELPVEEILKGGILEINLSAIPNKN